MIEKILERLEALKEDAYDKWDGGASHRAYTKAIEVVQEVAKEYGKDTNVRSNEEVIRCKDCKHFSGGGLWDNGYWCGRTARVGDCDKVTENDFCSRAEALAKMGGK